MCGLNVQAHSFLCRRAVWRLIYTMSLSPSPKKQTRGSRVSNFSLRLTRVSITCVVRSSISLSLEQNCTPLVKRSARSLSTQPDSAIPELARETRQTLRPPRWEKYAGEPAPIRALILVSASGALCSGQHLHPARRRDGGPVIL